MRAKALAAASVFVAMLGVAGCNSVPDPMKSALSTPVPTPPPRVAPSPHVSTPAPVIATAPLPPIVTAPALNTPAPEAGVVGSVIGQSLDDKDRNTAIAAQQEAVVAGTRKSWRGAHGAYGFIVPGPESGSCRDYTHRIFINGRPKEAKGQACKEDGVWRVTG